MSSQKRFLAVTLTIFIVISSLTITGMAMLFDGLTQLGEPRLMGLANVSPSISVVQSFDVDYCSASANSPASLSTS